MTKDIIFPVMAMFFMAVGHVEGDMFIMAVGLLAAGLYVGITATVLLGRQRDGTKRR